MSKSRSLMCDPHLRPAFESHRFRSRSRCLLSAALAAFTATATPAPPVALRTAASGADGGRDSDAPIEAAVATAAPRAVTAGVNSSLPVTFARALRASSSALSARARASV